MEQGAVDLREGELFVVPKGVRHNPDVVTDKTRSIDEQLRPLRASAGAVSVWAI